MNPTPPRTDRFVLASDGCWEAGSASCTSSLARSTAARDHCSNSAGSKLAPALLCGLHDEPQLVDLLLDGEGVALDRGREAALGREAELVEVDVLGGLLDPAFQEVLALELALLGRHQAEHDDLALGHEAQRLEAAG